MRRIDSKRDPGHLAGWFRRTPHRDAGSVSDQYLFWPFLSAPCHAYITLSAYGRLVSMPWPDGGNRLKRSKVSCEGGRPFSGRQTSKVIGDAVTGQSSDRHRRGLGHGGGDSQTVRGGRRKVVLTDILKKRARPWRTRLAAPHASTDSTSPARRIGMPLSRKPCPPSGGSTS